MRFMACAPLLTAITSYPASLRIFFPMFWAVKLSSANRIFKQFPFAGESLAPRYFHSPGDVNAKMYVGNVTLGRVATGQNPTRAKRAPSTSLRAWGTRQQLG